MLSKISNPSRTQAITLGQAIYQLLQKVGLFQNDFVELKAQVTETKTVVEGLGDRISTLNFDISQPVAEIRGDIQNLQTRMEELLTVGSSPGGQMPDILEPQFEAFACLRLFKTLDELTLDQSASKHETEFNQCREALQERCLPLVPTDQHDSFKEEFEAVAKPFVTAKTTSEDGQRERSRRYQQIQKLRLKLLNYCAFSEDSVKHKTGTKPAANS